MTAARDAETVRVQCRWIVDAAGRASFLKKRLGLAMEAPHDINAWVGRMSERGLRWLSTNHLLDKGYWVWLIPLSSGSTSIGIVADPRIHFAEPAAPRRSAR